MIYDRTAADVSYADTLRKKLQAGQSLTEAEKAVFERGACTTAMLNRVESKQSELATALNGYSYMVSISNKQWTSADIFGYADYVRLLDNLSKLRQAFFVYETTPATPAYIYGYKEANYIEKILADIESMIDDMKGRFRQCGTFQCGEVNNL